MWAPGASWATWMVRAIGPSRGTRPAGPPQPRAGNASRQTSAVPDLGQNSLKVIGAKLRQLDRQRHRHPARHDCRDAGIGNHWVRGASGRDELAQDSRHVGLDDVAVVL